MGDGDGDVSILLHGHGQGPGHGTWDMALVVDERKFKVSPTPAAAR